MSWSTTCTTGFTHVELLPVAEHPFGGSWGYQVTSYYAPTSRYGTPDDFRYFVDTLHAAGIGVLMDWVPAHFPRDEWALAQFDGARAATSTPTRGAATHPDWGTLIFDYGRNEVRNFLVANALYWLEEFHLDGLRVDAVASMLYLDYSRKAGEWSPNEYGGRENLDAVAFLQEMNATVYKRHPGVVTIAEESTAWPGVTRPTHLGGLGFGFKWNMGWMHDTLSYVGHDPVHRGYHHNEMTFSLMYACSARTSCCRSRTTRWCTARARCGAGCPATTGTRLANLRACWPTCGPTPASSCCSWAASSGSPPNGRRTGRWTGICATIRCTAVCWHWSGTSTPPTDHTARCSARTAAQPVSSGSTPTMPGATC